MNPKSPKSSSHRPGIEPLESRFAPASTALIHAGTLFLSTHDHVADHLVIDDANHDGIIDINGENVAGASFDAIHRIAFSGKGDTAGTKVVVDPGNDVSGFDHLRYVFRGGEGNDHFNLNSVQHTFVALHGAGGDDRLTAIRVGEVHLLGGAGDNSIVSHVAHHIANGSSKTTSGGCVIVGSTGPDYFPSGGPSHSGEDSGDDSGDDQGDDSGDLNTELAGGQLAAGTGTEYTGGLVMTGGSTLTYASRTLAGGGDMPPLSISPSSNAGTLTIVGRSISGGDVPPVTSAV